MSGERHVSRAPVVLFAASLLALACGSEVEEPASQEWKGYLHTADKTGFPLGTDFETVEEAGYLKLIGDNGVFAIDQTNGSAMASPDANAPVLQQPPLGPAEVHGARARSYFEAAGIVASQIGGVQTNAGSGAYYSLLERAVDGIAIADSVAWVRFNAADEVVSEAVYWPAIPSNVVEDARALTKTLASPASAAAYKAKLPAGLGDAEGAVAVRHTDFTWRKAFSAVAVYDVVDGSTVRHFGPSGEEVKLANETP